MIGQPIAHIIPDELLEQEEEILGRIRRGERIEHYITECVAKGGARVTLCVTASPLKDQAGNNVGAMQVARCVTERKQASDIQRHLSDELDHRVKNTLATVLAFAGLSRRRAVADPERFTESFTGRIQALARTHNLLVEGKMLGSDIACLVSEEINHGALDDGRAVIAGPLIKVDARTAGQLGLVIHELASNARRHGALAHPSGMLRVEWSAAESDPTELALHWMESGAPKVIVRPVPSLSISLIHSAIASLDGAVDLRIEPDGLRCTIRLPLPKTGMRPPVS